MLYLFSMGLSKLCTFGIMLYRYSTWSYAMAQKPKVQPDDTRLVYDVPEAGALLGLTRNGSYAAAARGDIPTIRIGRLIKVPRAALERMLATCS